MTAAATRLRAPRIVLTGGPGAGKTAVLEVVRQHFPKDVVVLPEAASIIFGGGFPRRLTDTGRRSAQRAIFHVQRELEELAEDEREPELVLCDRGTLDGLAYWPGDPAELLRDVGTSIEAELARYALVIHLRTPGEAHGYNHQNPLRIESAREAAEIDVRIGEIWRPHPRVMVIQNQRRFTDKLNDVLEVIRRELAARSPELMRAATNPETRGASDAH